MIMNKMYENQNLLYIVPLVRHIIVVWISSISPMAKGCFICVVAHHPQFIIYIFHLYSVMYHMPQPSV
jgi:hypothetical protein